MKIITNKQTALTENNFSYTLHPLLQKIYSARGVRSDVELNTELSALLKPDSLKGLDSA